MRFKQYTIAVAVSMLVLVIMLTSITLVTKYAEDRGSERGLSASVLVADQSARPSQEQLIAAYEKGLKALKAENYETAIGNFDYVIKWVREYPNALVYRAKANQALANVAAAEADLKEAIRINSNNIEAIAELALLYKANGDDEQATIKFTDALLIDPTRFDLWFQQGLSHLKLKQYNQAIDSFSQTIGLNNQQAAAYHHRAEAYENQGNYEKALADYEQALALSDENPISHVKRAQLMVKFGDFEGALKNFSKTLELEPSNEQALLGRAEIHHENNDYPAALKDLSTLLQVNPEEAIYYRKRSMVYQALGQQTEAQIDLDIYNALLAK